MRHPLQWGLASGVVLFALIGFQGDWTLGLVIGGAVGLFNALIWLKGGPVHRWRAWMSKRFSKKTL